MSAPPPGTWRLFAPAVSAWVACAVMTALPGSWRFFAVLAGGAGMLIFGFSLLRRFVFARQLFTYIGVSCAALLVLAVRIDGVDMQRSSAPLDAAIEKGDRVGVEITVSGYLQHSSVEWFQGRLVSADDEGGHTGAGGPGAPIIVWLTEDASLPVVAPGARVSVEGSVVALETTSQASYGVRADGDVRGVSDPPALSAFAASLREKLTERASKIAGAELVPGFAVGDTALVSSELDRDMRDSSLTHLVAVSGANCALITTCAMWAASWLGAGRRIRLGVAGVCLLGFVGLVGPDVSVQRAAIMGGVVLLSGYGGKRAVALPSLSIAMFALLMVDPWQAWQPGYALSVAATAGIVLFVPALSAALVRTLRLPRVLVLPIAVSIAAQIACGPFLLLLQEGMPVAGVLANVLAGPAAPFGTGLGVLALLADAVAPVLAEPSVFLASLAARWVAATATVCAGLPGARLDWPAGPFGALLLAVGTALVLAAWLLASGRLTTRALREVAPWRGPKPSSPALRRTTAVLIALAAGIFVGPTAVEPLIEHATAPKEWRIAACDVGQGDAVLLRGAGEARGAILVDTGDDAAALGDCLSLFGVQQIELLVLTHDHRDHVGALDEVIGRVDRAIIAPWNVEDGDDRPIARELHASGVSLMVGRAGMSGTDAGIDWEILAPAPGARPETSNGSSVVMLADTGDATALLLGDTGENEQRALARSATPQVDIVKVAHHGSKDQDPEFYRQAAATFGLISVGADNGYGHPARDTLDLLADAGTKPLRTDDLGSVAVRVENGAVIAWAAEPAGSAAESRTAEGPATEG